jgi:flagellar hook-basal body protein
MLDSTGTAFTKTANVAFDPSQSTYNNKTTQTLFDSNGNSHTLEVYYRRVTDETLTITSGDAGYTYTPSDSASANTAGTTKVTLNKDSILRVNTAPMASALSTTATTTSSTFTLTATPSLGGSEVTPTTGMKIFINGVDSGKTVSAFDSSSKLLTLAAGSTSGTTLSVPTGASVTFYEKDYDTTTTAITTANTNILAVTANTGLVVGDKVFTGSTGTTDTGLTITKIEGLSITLSGSVSTSDTASSTKFTFKRPLAMTLITPDGTEVAVNGASNRKASTEILTTTVAQVEVYASIDNTFYNYPTDGSVSSNRTLAAEVVGGYKPVATMNFMGGKNIDAMVKDSMSGDPMFKTTTKLTSRVTNQAGGSSDLIFELDLSGTQLHAGAFQMTKSTQNGEAVARLTNVTVDNQGRIVGVYGSGKQQFIGQVAMVNFDNETGLIPVGKNAFTTSNITGTEQDGTGVSVGRAGTGVMGEIRSQALESSNVDLANELVRLMILQRSYSANSQSLKAVDQTLRDTLQMVG